MYVLSKKSSLAALLSDTASAYLEIKMESDLSKSYETEPLFFDSTSFSKATGLLGITPWPAGKYLVMVSSTALITELGGSLLLVLEVLLLEEGFSFGLAPSVIKPCEEVVVIRLVEGAVNEGVAAVSTFMDACFGDFSLIFEPTQGLFLLQEVIVKYKKAKVRCTSLFVFMTLLMP